ncbi:MAG: amino acid ABC transporter permease [Oscillospiraceae bacterium]|nr:amino acid ABC transporter permease [Oscillospiraceae bacterium]
MTFGERILFLFAKYGPSYLDGAKNTLIVAIISTAVGCLIGLGAGIIQTIPTTKEDNLFKRALVRLCKILLGAYVELFRGTPMMIQAVFIYYGIPIVFGYYMDTLPAAFLIVSINTGAYMAETVRGGILSIDPGQTEGAKAIGMTHVQTMLSVILPQTLRNIMPQIGNNLIINIKDTCVLSVISVVELFFAHKGVAGATYCYFESATIVMAMYLIMTVFFSKLLRWVEKKMDGNASYDLATTDTLAHTTGMYSYPGKGSNFDERSKEYGGKEGK